MLKIKSDVNALSEFGKRIRYERRGALVLMDRVALRERDILVSYGGDFLSPDLTKEISSYSTVLLTFNSLLVPLNVYSKGRRIAFECNFFGDRKIAEKMAEFIKSSIAHRFVYNNSDLDLILTENLGFKTELNRQISSDSFHIIRKKKPKYVDDILGRRLDANYFSETLRHMGIDPGINKF